MFFKSLRFKDWALQGAYGFRSDMYQVGVLLSSLAIYTSHLKWPALLTDLVTKLKEKSLTAQDALKHDWITTVI